VRSYILGRLLVFVAVLFGTSLVVFWTVRLLPGDPVDHLVSEVASPEFVENLRKELDLDKPVAVQYLTWLGRLARADLGLSITDRQPVMKRIVERFPATIELTIASMLVAGLIGITAGIVSATRPYSVFDNASMLVALAGVAVPVFWLGPMLILIFAVQLRVLPVAGSGGPQFLVLPAVTVGLASAGLIARMTRSAMLETLAQDYVRTARAKGLHDRVVVLRHAFRNALLPIVTILALQTGYLMGGAVIAEAIFAWPGIGQLIVESVYRRDYPMVQGTLLLFAATFAAINFVVDTTYGFLDPRIRYA
jgi:ABC-type dipeptide/oligopeptide/nickel transport system permease component